MLGGFEYFVREGYPVEGEHADRHEGPERPGLPSPRETMPGWSG